MFKVLPDETPVHQFDIASRELGSIVGELPGPSILATGGIHGNEPAGVAALIRVMEELRRSAIPFRGQIHAVVGNLNALRHHLRFIDTDLNRMWKPGHPEQCAELDEKRELDAYIQERLVTTPKPHILLDLHTTSAEGAPFCLLGSQNPAELRSSLFTVPQIIGLIDLIPGTLAHHLVHQGHRAFVFEGGQHRVPKTLQNLEHAIWLFLVEVGCLAEQDVVDLAERQAALAAEAVGLPRFLDVKYRHPVLPSDEFMMKPGFFNFDRVEKGQLLAWDRSGEIHAPFSGRILMPLYQGQGTDGFFLGVGLDENGQPEN
ncbi:MAG: succinylglutamate desuccinylase/aspartoacylase family protein [Acidobacteria bacterium]|nr:succinylglutamate desuccinylase/aspartoacylase family protein [Acidobacteriota bacterium]MCB9396976.1 succinylglutamate desuccinylase/aspartoacylase family protein [Acidobacteriota bacterium]